MLQSQTTCPRNVNHPHAQTLYAYTGQYSDELSFPAGITLMLVKRVDAEWWEGRVDGRTGLVPGNYIEVIEEPVARDNQDTLQESVGLVVMQGCHHKLSSAFDLLLIFHCSLIETLTLTPPPNNTLLTNNWTSERTIYFLFSSPPTLIPSHLPIPPSSLSLLHPQDEWSEDSDEEKGKITYYFRGAARTMEVDLGLLEEPSLLPLQWAIQ